MGDLTRNLSKSEFKCSCGCGKVVIDGELANKLQGVVDHFQATHPTYDVGIHINSGYRCPTHNKAEGGKPEETNWRGIPIHMTGSFHLYGLAADFYLYNKRTSLHIPEDSVATYLEQTYPFRHGIGRYKGRTHFDVREKPARWDYR